MMSQKAILSAAAIIFVVGGGIIVWNGRPVAQMAQNNPPATSDNPTPSPTPTVTSPPPALYTLATVALHNSQSDCWSAVNGGVYNLTSWIGRHPGGPGPILGMCGTDGSAAYNGQHGGARRPQAFLALLKIGTLQP